MTNEEFETAILTNVYTFLPFFNNPYYFEVISDREIGSGDFPQSYLRRRN